MIVIQEILISEELFSNKFTCHLDRCKGACCWEGDFGAPVLDGEIDQIAQSLDIIKKQLTEESIDCIEKLGIAPYDKNYNGRVTPLLRDGTCAYLNKSSGIGVCSFEKAFHDREIDFIKPLSCHLYPVRVISNERTGFEALNYDEWDICSAACSLGEELNMPVFRFVKDAIIRKYGHDFYDEMESYYKSHH